MKKKGRAPAHQNKVAFHHNPKSKKTEVILSSPIEHACRRCLEKLEWRKRYRKYKPRTVPGKCNICTRRNVTAAYHTICEECTRKSEKATTLLDELNRKDHGNDHNNQNEYNDHGVDEKERLERKTAPVERPYRRICAVCVKEPALPESDDDKDPREGRAGDDREADDRDGKKPMRLRELKTLNRKSERRKERTGAADRFSAPTSGGSYVEDESDDGLKHSIQGGDDCSGFDDNDAGPDDESADDDPFLAAVGGPENLLVGEAYQHRMLNQHQRRQEEQARDGPDPMDLSS